MERVGKHPDRIENLYFLYALMLQAVSKLDNYFDLYTYCTGNKIENLRTQILLKDTMSQITQKKRFVDVDKMFLGDEKLKDEFKSHFRNISKIIDCVSCEKCRLWGRVQVSGIGAALKILFSFDPATNTLKKAAPDSFYLSSKKGTKYGYLCLVVNGF